MTGRNIVVWSGGADSTLVLNDYAGVSSEDYPVVALSVAGHRFLGSEFLKAQGKAQAEYLKLAKKRGYHIRHEKILFSGNYDWGVKKNCRDDGAPSAQSVMWLSAVMNVVGEGDKVHFGYIKGDCFWHYREQFEAAFGALCALKGVKAKLNYRLEWERKGDVLRRLKGAKIPQRCWFSCEYTKNGKPCGSCAKCDEIKMAKLDWRFKSSKRPE